MIKLLALTWPLVGCVNGWFRASAGYDARPLTVATLSLFNQRVPSRLTTKPWKGDWIFRRERLALIDQELRNTKPDLFVMQEVIERQGETAESDRSILMAGALADYGWSQEQVQEYTDTQEAQFMAMAAGLPLKFPIISASATETWPLGTGGYLLATTVDYEGQPLTVFNVQMPSSDSSALIWYRFIQERILAKMRKDHLCPNRLIVAGYLPGDESGQRFSDFLQSLQLKDAAAGYCQIAGLCFTATPANDLFMATVGEETPTRTDRLFVHQSALIYSSSRAFAEANEANPYAREFGLERLWASQRFGWRSQLRLARCEPDAL